MGTPDPEDWPEMPTLHLYKPDMPKYPGVAIEKLCPKLEESGLDLLSKMLSCNPENRISAKEAMKHPFLEDVPEEIKAQK
jgi:serine/threonine protein kinase